MKVSPRLSEILTERNLRQKDLAEMAGTTEATISRFSRQSRYEIETLIRISRALNLQIEELFTIEK
ncbi:helix-turn-helix transcriptional regulator [Bacillus thuringiensis]